MTGSLVHEVPTGPLPPPPDHHLRSYQPNHLSLKWTQSDQTLFLPPTTRPSHSTTTTTQNSPPHPPPATRHPSAFSLQPSAFQLRRLVIRFQASGRRRIDGSSASRTPTPEDPPPSGPFQLAQRWSLPGGAKPQNWSLPTGARHLEHGRVSVAKDGQVHGRDLDVGEWRASGFRR